MAFSELLHITVRSIYCCVRKPRSLMLKRLVMIQCAYRGMKQTNNPCNAATCFLKRKCAQSFRNAYRGELDFNLALPMLIRCIRRAFPWLTMSFLSWFTNVPNYPPFLTTLYYTLLCFEHRLTQ